MASSVVLSLGPLTLWGAPYNLELPRPCPKRKRRHEAKIPTVAPKQDMDLGTPCHRNLGPHNALHTVRSTADGGLRSPLLSPLVTLSALVTCYQACLFFSRGVSLFRMTLVSQSKVSPGIPCHLPCLRTHPDRCD